MNRLCESPRLSTTLEQPKSRSYAITRHGAGRGHVVAGAGGLRSKHHGGPLRLPERHRSSAHERRSISYAFLRIRWRRSRKRVIHPRQGNPTPSHSSSSNDIAMAVPRPRVGSQPSPKRNAPRTTHAVRSLRSGNRPHWSVTLSLYSSLSVWMAQLVELPAARAAYPRQGSYVIV